MIDVWHLRNVHWLRDLPREESERLRRSATTRDHERGDTVFAPTATPESVFLLERGLVRIYRISEGGAETTFGYVLPGEVFGELSAFADGARESFAQAVRRSTVWRIPAETFRTVVSASHGMTLEITKQIAGRMKRIESRVEDLVFRDVRARLTRVLLELSESFGRPEGEGVEISLPLTQTDLATLVGSTRQTVNVALGALEREGLLVQRHRHIVLPKPAALRPGATRAVG
jgi:CRP-like cAMP-binding protein